MSNQPRNIWETEPKAPAPIVLAELQESPALTGLLAPVAEAATAMKAALEAIKASGDETARALLERIEVRDTTLIATLNEIVAAVSKSGGHAAPVTLNVPKQAPPVVNVAAPSVTVSPTIEIQPVSWTLTHSYDRAGNLVTTKAVPSA